VTREELAEAGWVSAAEAVPAHGVVVQALRVGSDGKPYPVGDARCFHLTAEWRVWAYGHLNGLYPPDMDPAYWRALP
jgi:hypothetical protein